MANSRSRSRERQNRFEDSKKSRRSKFDQPRLQYSSSDLQSQSSDPRLLQSPHQKFERQHSGGGNQTLTLDSKAKAAIAQFNQQFGNQTQANSGQILLSNGAIQIGSTGAFDLHARRLYVGGIPPHTPEKNIIDFLIGTLKEAGGVIEEGNPILKSINNPEKRYVFLELRSVDETSTLIQLDGIRYGESSLRIRRPEDYDKFPEIKTKKPVPKIDTVKLGIISTKVEEGPNKVFVGGLPKEFTEDQIKNLLQRYGKLKSFHLVRDNQDNQSKGFAFCEFSDDKGVQNALKYLNGMKIKSKNINVRKTGQNSYMVQQNMFTQEDKLHFENKLDDFIYLTHKLISETQEHKDIPTVQDQLDRHNEQVANYICHNFGYPYVTNIVSLKLPGLTPSMLDDDSSSTEIIDDLLSELRKFGTVKSVTVPKSRDITQTTTIKPSAIGKAFIEFEEVTSAFACYNLLYGKPFIGQQVTIDFYPVDQYLTKSLS